jgi:Fe-Mn family superoxide dismutase
MHPTALPASRRAVIQALGVGAALVSLGRAGALAQSVAAVSAPSAASSLRAPFVLPKLAYAYDALAPHIDARTMEIHHTKHHQSYITAANKALESRPELRELDAGELITRLESFEEPLRTALRNQLGGHLNHTFFWELLAPPAEYRAGPLRAAIVERFGSLEAFKAEFAQAAAGRFGSGWAWLVRHEGGLKVMSTANQDSPLTVGAEPLLGLDVWEHAYYLEYQNRRADYVKAFWQVLNWDVAEAAFARAKGA